VKIAIFHRVATMPTFPCHWAAVSGSIEAGETPWQTACREVMEETNLTCGITTTATASLLMEPQYGLYVDERYMSKSRNNSTSTIRVYPFTARLRNDTDAIAIDNASSPSLELRGTEHDRYQWVSVNELEALEPSSVPSLARAFHHATFGRYLNLQQQQQQLPGKAIDNNDETSGADKGLVLSPAMRTWASDQVNGASTMVANAVSLLLQIRDENSSSCSCSCTTDSVTANAARLLKMLRPSMVPITNILTLIESQQLSLEDAVNALRLETERAVDHAVAEIVSLVQQKCLRHAAKKVAALSQGGEAVDADNDSATAVVSFYIATFSRSSTILAILKRLILFYKMKHHDVGSEVVNIEILCGRSTPGNEGEIMARDVAFFCSSSEISSSSGAGSGGDWKVMCLDDDELEQRLSVKSDIDLLLTGSDCVMSDQVVNKVGTRRMAAEVKRQQQQQQQQERYRDDGDEHGGCCLVYCCADRFKLWQDCFPPPLEGIFECIPITPYFDRVLIPSSPLSTTTG
jgi:8-oxo-dGTP pyrophosphatase MutT (NUDIX family)/translation initiation factor 2B subunit (eIF-2B alpha/beta/delta family)